jgi:hypothetical protein
MRWVVPPELDDQPDVPFQQLLETQRSASHTSGDAVASRRHFAFSANLWKLLVASITWNVQERAGLAALLTAEGVLWDELLILEARVFMVVNICRA